jgi:hypothetical protein
MLSDDDAVALFRVLVTRFECRAKDATGPLCRKQVLHIAIKFADRFKE